MKRLILWSLLACPFVLAWGGSWGGMNGVDESALPCAMEVEYVRVFQKQDAGVNNH